MLRWVTDDGAVAQSTSCEHGNDVYNYHSLLSKSMLEGVFSAAPTASVVAWSPTGGEVGAGKDKRRSAPQKVAVLMSNIGG